MLNSNIVIYTLSLLAYWKSSVIWFAVSMLLFALERLIKRRQVSRAIASVLLVGGVVSSSFQVWEGDRRSLNELRDQLTSGIPNINSFDVFDDGNAEGGYSARHLLFTVDKKMYKPYIIFVFDGPIKNAAFPGSGVRFILRDCVVGSSTYLVDFESPALVKDQTYRLDYVSMAPVQPVRIFPILRE